MDLRETLETKAMTETGVSHMIATFAILLSISDLGVGLNLKQRQKQNTNGFSCILHLLTLGLINNSLYHNFGDKTVEKNQIETLEKKPKADRLNRFVNSLRSAFPMINKDWEPPFIVFTSWCHALTSS